MRCSEARNIACGLGRNGRHQGADVEKSLSLSFFISVIIFPRLVADLCGSYAGRCAAVLTCFFLRK